jgi:hypothetical protein
VARESGSFGTSGSPRRERRKFRSLTLAVTTALSALLPVLISAHWSARRPSMIKQVSPSPSSC